MEYFAKKSAAQITDKEADKIGKYLERVFPSGSNIKPKDIVKLAEPENSLLHKYFEWDDSKAARAYRLEQARHLLISIVVHIENKDVRAFHNIKLLSNDSKTTERGYWRHDVAKKSPSLWQQVIDAALKELYGWRDRYQTYSKLTPIIKSINTFEKKGIK